MAVADTLLETPTRIEPCLLESAHGPLLDLLPELSAAAGILPDPTSVEFVRRLHREFYQDAPESMLRIEGEGRSFIMTPGEFRSHREHDVAVGRHAPLQ